MKVVTVLGTRPEIIRLSRLIPRLDGACEHVLVHTGQNFAAALSDVFFDELGVRAPDHDLGVRGEDFAQRVGAMIAGCGRLLAAERPDRLLVLGDTDSGLAATLVAKRLGIAVYHMEAGNRCFDDRVPEEVNRRVIDHASDVLLPYTRGSHDNLVREGVGDERITITGNPINEVLRHYAQPIAASAVVDRLGLEAGGFLLMTMHRQETVDHEQRLRSLMAGAAGAARAVGLPLVCSVHPRTRSRIASFGVALDAGVVFAEPFGFFDFVALERAARCVLTDSGTVQEECCILHVPAVTVRDSTERPETIDCGSNVLSGVEPAAIGRSLRLMLDRPPTWDPPPEYLATDVSGTVLGILLER